MPRRILLALIAIALGWLSWLPRPQPPDPRRASQPPLACPTAADVAAIRADPATFDAHAARCREELLALLGPRATDAEATLVYATRVAHQMAPYGLSLAIDLDDLLAEPRLDCDNYAWLAMQLYARSAQATGRVRMVVWEHPRLGVHAQIAAEWPSGRALLLDPTANLIARAALGDVIIGDPVPSRDVLAMPLAWDSPEAAVIRDHVRDALRLGMFAPEHLILLSDDPTPQMRATARQFAQPPPARGP